MASGDVGLSGDTWKKRPQNSFLDIAATSFPHELSPPAPFPQTSSVAVWSELYQVLDKDSRR